jgi:hypothetical protein
MTDSVTAERMWSAQVNPDFGLQCQPAFENIGDSKVRDVCRPI